MDLKKMVEDVEVYSAVYEELHELIDVYLNKYKLCELKYNTKKDLWIKGLLEEFKEIYKGFGFEIKEEKRRYDMPYDKSTYFEYIATYKSLEFEMTVNCESDIYQDIRFLQTKPNSSAFNFELRTTIDMYKVDFEIDNNEKYGRKKTNIFRIDQVDEIKENLEETKYNVDEMKDIISIIRSEKEKLERKLKEIEEKDFIGYIYKDKDKIEFTSLNNLVELI